MGRVTSDGVNQQTYADQCRERMESAQGIIRDCIGRNQEKKERQYNKTVHVKPPQLGLVVYLSNPGTEVEVQESRATQSPVHSNRVKPAFLRRGLVY